MCKPSNNVVSIFSEQPEKALEALNRLTGLDWGELPVSIETSTDTEEVSACGDVVITYPTDTNVHKLSVEDTFSEGSLKVVKA